jgi:hypothetical protein
MFSDPTDDPITSLPKLNGPYGRAWQLDLKALVTEPDAAIDLWLVEAPYAHPVWHSYMLFLMHLRPLPDFPPPIFYLEGATHEFHIWALDASAQRQHIIDTGQWGEKRLNPMNFAVQVKMDDDEVKSKLRFSIVDILHGRISPDTDYRSRWARLWGDNMIK